MESLLFSTGMLSIAFGRVFVGAILLVAGRAKLGAGARYLHNVILGYDLVPVEAAKVLAQWLPWLELACGGLLVIGLMSQVAAILATGLLLVFSAAIAMSLLRGRRHDCGCFSQPSSVRRVQWRLVYRNLALIAILLPVYAFEGGALSLDGWISLRALDKNAATTGLLVLIGVWLSAFGATVLLTVLTQYRSDRQPHAELHP